LGLFLAQSIVGLFAAFPVAIVGAMMFLVGIEMTKFAKDTRWNLDLLPLLATLVASLWINMACGFLLGLVVYYGMQWHRRRFLAG
jgi:MFS superfamily sulfate permease-like transporter